MSNRKLALHQDTGAADLAAGWLITPEFSSREGFRIDAGGKKVPDDKALAARVQTVLNQSHRILRTWCAPAFAALYFVPSSDFAGLDEALDDLRLESYALNEAARIIGSDRETTIEIFPTPLDVHSLRVSLRVGQTIYRHLTRLKDSLAFPGSGDERAFGTEWRVTKNLDKLVTGAQHSIVHAALRSIKTQRDDLGTGRPRIAGLSSRLIGRSRLSSLRPARSCGRSDRPARAAATAQDSCAVMVRALK
jgi:hypothetical protein